MPTLAEILLNLQQNPRGRNSGNFAPADPSPLLALLSGGTGYSTGGTIGGGEFGTGNIEQQSGWMPPPQPQLPVLNPSFLDFMTQPRAAQVPGIPGMPMSTPPVQANLFDLPNPMSTGGWVPPMPVEPLPPAPWMVAHQGNPGPETVPSAVPPGYTPPVVGDRGQGPSIAELFSRLAGAMPAISLPPSPPMGPVDPNKPLTSQGVPVAVSAAPSAASAAPAEPMAGIKFGLPEAPASMGGPRTINVGGPTGGAPDPLSISMSLIREKEGFRDKPYWDVNALRTGYGSDTVTLADGTVKPVGKDTKVGREDAERDLQRRTTEYMGMVTEAAGGAQLSPNVIAAATSVAYNYGKVPDTVAAALKTGDPQKIATAIEGLQGHNEGVNAERRKHEAEIARGNAMPGAPNYQAPQLPTPSPTIPLQGINPAAFDKFNALTVTKPTPLSTGDRLTTILGSMAANAMGAKDVGSFLLAMGAGAGAGAAKNIATMRGEAKEVGEKEDALKKFLAGIEVQKAEATTQGQNYKIAAQNKDADLLNQVATEQAKLDAAARNKVEEHKNAIDWKKWELFQPQIKADKDGVTIIKRKPDGSMDVTIQKGNEMDALADRMEDANKVFGKGSEVTEALKYQALAKQGEPWVRRQIMRDMVEKNMLNGALGEDQYKKFRKEAEKAVDQNLRGKPEEFEAQVKQRMTDMLWAMSGQKDANGKPLLPDEGWLPYMLRQKNFGAILLARPAGG